MPHCQSILFLFWKPSCRLRRNSTIKNVGLKKEVNLWVKSFKKLTFLNLFSTQLMAESFELNRRIWESCGSRDAFRGGGAGRGLPSELYPKLPCGCSGGWQWVVGGVSGYGFADLSIWGVSVDCFSDFFRLLRNEFFLTTLIRLCLLEFSWFSLTSAALSSASLSARWMMGSSTPGKSQDGEFLSGLDITSTAFVL